MGTLNERAEEWREGSGFTVSVQGGFPTSEMSVRYDLAEHGAKTSVTLALEYQMKYGASGGALDWVFINRTLRGALSHLRDGLKYRVETGNPVGSAVPGR